MLKKLIILSLLIITVALYSEVYTVYIGDEEIVFAIPADYDTLKKYYKEVIDTYVEAENDMLKVKSTVLSIEKSVDNMNNISNDYRDKLLAIEEAYKQYTKATFFTIYSDWGLGLYGVALVGAQPNTAVTLYYSMDFMIKQKHHGTFSVELGPILNEKGLNGLLIGGKIGFGTRIR